MRAVVKYAEEVKAALNYRKWCMDLFAIQYVKADNLVKRSLDVCAYRKFQMTKERELNNLNKN